MSAARERVWLALCVGVLALGFMATAAAAGGGVAPSVVVFGIALSFVPYAGTMAFSRVLGDVPRPAFVAAAATTALGAIWLFAPPVLSDDLYRYLWEGRLWLEGLNPYDTPPDDASLAPLRDDVWSSINNKPLASVYPPLSQLLVTIAAWSGAGALAVKLIALAGLAATAGLVARVTGDVRVALGVGFNPLLSSESALNGHFDALVGAAFLTIAWALSKHRFARAGVAVCVAVGLKVVGLIALPLLWRRPRVLVATGLASALLLVPLAASRDLADASSGAGQFAARWQGNDSVFAIADWLSRLLFADPVAGLVARMMVAVTLLVVVATLVKRRVPAVLATRVLLWTVLLLSPQVHPWYLAWLLPLELAAGGRAALIWSAAVLCAYVPLDGWVERGVWEMPPSIQILEYSVVAAALFADYFRKNSSHLG